jgi:pyridoxamine 5'-phosphate oxidase
VAPLATLGDIKAAVWQELSHATRDKQHAWRSPVLATVGQDGADARTVILREVDASARVLRIYTDDRAAKVAQVMSHPVGTLVMWSPALGWQVRCRARLAVQPQGLATTSRWALVKLSPAAQDYLSPLPPGAALVDEASGASALTASGKRPAPQPHFAIIEAQVLSIDWLELKRSGHRRAVFDGGGARWVQP